MIVPAVTAAVALAALIIIGSISLTVIRSVQRRAEREQARYEAREREWYAERTELLNRLGHALQKPWTYAPVEQPQTAVRFPDESEVLTDPGMVGTQVYEVHADAVS